MDNRGSPATRQGGKTEEVLVMDIGVGWAILIVAAGYLLRYAYEVMLARRKDRLARINRQLKEFYGPLLALVRISRDLADTLGEKGIIRGVEIRKGGEGVATEDQKTEWRFWMIEGFMPLLEKMQKLVVEHADLLEDEEMPRCLVQLSTHIVGYKALVQKWRGGDVSQHHSLTTHYPGVELTEYVTKNYLSLKRRQQKELAQSLWS